ncbi:MAG TPA: sugar transferase [Erythrobacter sp.]|nr:sugar transferase [Erythrobacter sp.]
MLDRTNTSLATTSKSPLAGSSERLAFYLLAGLGAPAVIWSTLRGVPLGDEQIRATLIELFLANMGSWYLLERLHSYARARMLSYVVPANLSLFGIFVLLNAVSRISISFSLFIACFLCTLAISFLVTLKRRRPRPSLQHYLVTAGSAGELEGKYGFIPLGSIEEFNALIEEGRLSGSVVADLHHDHDPDWERLFAKAALEGIPVYHYRLIEETLSGEVKINHLRENDLGSLIPNLPYMSAKRAFDLIASILVAPAILILGGVIAIAIKLDSPGSAFFIQDRVGFRGQVFRMVKFRTMREAPKADHKEARREQSMTQDDDQRITRVGRLLRKTRLDELPQAWNILLGEMSWIGPRPEAQDLAEWYEGEIPFYSYRHIVRPGITGWAQVNQGHVTSLQAVEAKLRFDFYYVKNLSLWLDVLIALKTLRVVVVGIGAK